LQIKFLPVILHNLGLWITTVSSLEPFLLIFLFYKLSQKQICCGFHAEQCTQQDAALILHSKAKFKEEFSSKIKFFVFGFESDLFFCDCWILNGSCS